MYKISKEKFYKIVRMDLKRSPLSQKLNKIGLNQSITIRKSEYKHRYNAVFHSHVSALFTQTDKRFSVKGGPKTWMVTRIK